MRAPVEWDEIILHHTVTLDSDGAEIDKIREWHRVVQGWSDIGYHWIVERLHGELRAIMARPMYREGSHTKGRNHRALGIALVGNFMAEPPDDEMLQVSADLIAGLWAVAGRRLPVRAHSDHWPTECPGAAFPIDRIVTMAEARTSLPAVIG